MKTARSVRIAGVGAAVVVASILAVIALAGGWTQSAESGSDDSSLNLVSEQNRPLPVSVVRLGEISPPVRSDDYRGTLQPSREAELAFRRSGKIAEILVEEGAQVSQGQLLARLDSADIAAVVEATRSRIVEAESVLSELINGPREQTIAAAQAEVEQLEATVELAKITAARERELQASKASSAQSYDNARFNTLQQLAALEAAKQRLDELKTGTRPEQLAAQKARLATLQAELKGFQVDLSDSQILAPFDGVISKRYVDEGIIAGPEKLVLRLIKIDPMEARFGLAPEDVSGLEGGQVLQMMVGQVQIQGTISNIEPEVDMATRTQAVLVSINNNADQQNQRSIVVGRTISLSLPRSQTQDENSYWVPITALTRSTRGLWSVLALTPEDGQPFRLERRDVQVRETDTQLARISGGMIQRGEQIVSDGLHRVTTGMQVEPVLDSTKVARNQTGISDAKDGAVESITTSVLNANGIQQ